MRYAWLLFAACSSPAAKPDAYTGDSTPAKAVACATTFGAELTNSFGRLDGTVLAVIPPNFQGCAQPTSTHTVVQVMVNGAAYRMVVNVLSTVGTPDVFLGEADAPLAGPAWTEGWHPDAQLDYATTLHVMKSQFTEAAQATAAARVYDMVALGEHISVFATSSGGAKADSADKIHRNTAHADGAIVLHPDTAPHYLLTAFANQSF